MKRSVTKTKLWHPRRFFAAGFRDSNIRLYIHTMTIRYAISNRSPQAKARE